MPGTYDLAKYFSRLRLKDVPAPIVSEAKRILVDTVGCAFGGARTEIGLATERSLFIFGSEPTAVAVGLGRRMSLAGAAYATGRLANALDYDETFPVGAHFASGAVAVALALGEANELSGEDVLLSIIVGYEVGARVASMIGPTALVEDGRVIGFPSVWGVAAPVVIAAAAATAKALKLDAPTFAQALNVAASNAPLPAGAQWSGAVELPNCKYCDAGWCAVTGLAGATLATNGVTGFDRILDDEAGLLKSYGCNGEHAHLLTEGLGETWLLSDVTYKPWPTCRYTHYPLTALQRLIDEVTFDVSQIDRIVLETNPLANSERFRQRDPKTFASRQFSYPHMAALHLLGVPAGPAWMDSAWDESPDVIELKGKTEIVLHPRSEEFAKYFDRNQMRQTPGGARIWVNGVEHHREVEFADGDPWHHSTYFTDTSIDEKFLRLSGGECSRPLLNDLRRIEDMPGIAALSNLLMTTNRMQKVA